MPGSAPSPPPADGLGAGPLVSVVMPAYNSARFLGEAIESVLSQAYQPLELIVVDDGSTDATAEVVQPYLGRLAYIFQDNAGVCAARNRGLREARGEFVVFADSDDILLPDKLELQVAAFIDLPGVDIVQSGWQIVSSDGKPLETIKPWEQVPLLDLENFLLWKPVLPGALMFRRTALLQVGGFDPQLRQAEDVDLLLRLLRTGSQAVWLRRTTVSYRQHDANTIQGGREQAQSLTAALDKFFAEPGLPLRLRLLEDRARFNSYLWLVWHLQRTGEGADIPLYLEKAQRHSRFQPTSVLSILEWQSKLAQFAARAGDPVEETRKVWSSMQSAAGMSGTAWSEAQAALEFWLSTWRHYAVLDRLRGLRGLRKYENQSLETVLALAAPAAFISAVEDLRAGRMFDGDLRQLQIRPHAGRFSTAALYLSLWSQALVRRMFRLSARSLTRAISSGFSYRAVRIWYRSLGRLLVRHAWRYIDRRLKVIRSHGA